jgi:hypothetical protein
MTSANPSQPAIKGENVAGTLDDANRGRQPSAQSPGDDRSKAIVAAIGIADAGDQ